MLSSAVLKGFSLRSESPFFPEDGLATKIYSSIYDLLGRNLSFSHTHLYFFPSLSSAMLDGNLILAIYHNLGT